MIELRFFVELLVGLVRIHVASLSDSYDVRMLCELFVGDWTMELSILVFVEV